MCRRTEVFILGYDDISLDDRLSSFLISYHLDLLVVVRIVVCDILLGVSAVEEILDLVIDERLDSNPLLYQYYLGVEYIDRLRADIIRTIHPMKVFYHCYLFPLARDSNHGVDNFRQIGDDYTFILTGEI